MANPERNLFDPPDAPYAAYNLEGQAFAVRQAQLDGRLSERGIRVRSIDVLIERGVKWYRLNDSILFSGDCDEEIGNLKPGMRIREIDGIDSRPDIFDGRKLEAVAAVLHDGKILYQSPGFDLEEYQSSFKKSKEK